MRPKPIGTLTFSLTRVPEPDAQMLGLVGRAGIILDDEFDRLARDRRALLLDP
jgi:hypothetical protein